jgi:tRNA(Ile)-lysidine synthase
MARPQNRLVSAVAAALARARVGADSSIVLGLSGGADSVALLHVLLELQPRFGFRLAAAHLNHRLRAAEADRDEAFVRDQCGRLNVQLIVEHASGLDVTVGNLEERAREARRNFFERAADELGTDFIALAHQADDQAETVLMRILRGAGVTGLAAMAEHGPGRIIRPMLQVSREEILDYVRDRNLEFVEDSSNASRSILRNRVRHELIPMIEREYAPAIARRLAELGGEMQGVDALVAELAERELDALTLASGVLDVSRLAGVPEALINPLLRRFIARTLGGLRRIERSHVDELRRLALEGGPSAVISLPGGWRAEREYSVLKLLRRISPPRDAYSIPLALDGDTRIDAARLVISSSRKPADSVAMPASLCEAVFDGATVGNGGLVARNFRLGDRIAPLGFEGHRKVKDVYIDRRMTRAKRAVWPIVMLGEEIAWIPGLARARVGLITAGTEAVIRLETREMLEN